MTAGIVIILLSIALFIYVVGGRGWAKEAKYYRQEWVHQCEIREKIAIELVETKEALRVARKGLEAVSDLIGSSRGVSGLHLNGDEAPWEDLRQGGSYEEWLEAFDAALNDIPRQQDVVLTPDQVTCKVEPSPEQVAYRDQTGVNQ